MRVLFPQEIRFQEGKKKLKRGRRKGKKESDVDMFTTENF